MNRESKIADLRLRVNGRLLTHVPENGNSELDTIRLCHPCFGGEIRVEMPSDLFSADALCAAAFVQAVRRGDQKRCVVLVESSGWNSILPVMVDPDSGKTAAGIPVPEVERGNGPLKLTFPGLACLVGAGKSVPDNITSAVLLVERDESCSYVTACGRLKKEALTTVLPASGLAAAAAAIDYADAQPDGITEYEIGMDGGTIGVGVVMRGGQLSGLSVSSVVAWDSDDLIP